MLGQIFAKGRGPLPRFDAPSFDRQGCVLAEAMEDLGTLVQVDRNQEIFADQEPADHFYLVVSGVVRTCKFLVDGRRQIGSFHFAGDVFGFAAHRAHSISAEAVTSCRLLVVKRSTLVATAAQEADLASALWNAATQELEKAREHAVLLGRRNATERILSFFRGLAERGEDPAVIDIPMSRQDIADYLGLTIETVSRTITQIEESGTIALESSRRLRVRAGSLALA